MQSFDAKIITIKFFIKKILSANIKNQKIWQAMHVCNSYTAVASPAAAQLLLRTTNAVLLTSSLASLPAAVLARTDILFLDSPKRPMVLKKLLLSSDQQSTISFSLCLSDKHKHVNATTAPMNHSPCTPCFVAMIRSVWSWKGCIAELMAQPNFI